MDSTRTLAGLVAGATACWLALGAMASPLPIDQDAPSARPLGTGEARIWYLGHCGFAVRTAKHLLIFDYQERRDGPQSRTRGGAAGLDTGWVDPAAIARDKVRVFVSHSHEDHFDPVIFGWRKAVPDIAYYFGWKAADDPANHYLVGPRATYAGDGLEIFTINSHHSGVPEVAFLVKVDGLVIYHNGDYRMDYRADFPYLQQRVERIDLAFVLGVAGETEQYALQSRDLFERFKPGAVFPMHAEAGARMYREFEAAFGARIPGLPIMVPEKLGDRFEYRGGRIARSGPRSQPPSAPQDVFAFVRALDEAAARGVWPGFSPTGIPVALFDGEHTILLRHPSPPTEFSPMAGRPGVLFVNGRHPGVTGNSTREIGGVRTATVIATPAQPVERTMLAVVEEVFHVFWLARHPSFRPNEMARYAYPLDDVENLGRLVAEDEALARALEAQRIDDAAGWAAAALGIRRERVTRLAEDTRVYETSLEMMEGTANYVARVSVGEPASRTVERLRTTRPAEDIRWRFYDTGAALCLLLDRLSAGWQERSDRQPALPMVELMDEALRGRGAAAVSFPEGETAGFQARAAASIADLGLRRRRLRAELLERQGGRVVVEVAAGAEPFRVQRFDPINLMVLDAGAMAHANSLSLAVPQGSVELTNPAFVRGSFGGTVSITEAAGRHPLSDGVRRLTVAGIQGAPKVGRDERTVSVEAPGVRLTLRDVETNVEGDLVRIIVKGPRP